MYVIKNNRLKNYLYALGFNFEVQEDRTGQQEKVYLFKKSNMLLEAITYYTDFKNKYMKID